MSELDTSSNHINELRINELRIRGLSLDTRTLNSGELFIALKGLVQDGRRYIPEAIQKGAVAILTEVERLETGTKNENQESKNFEQNEFLKNIERSHIPVIYYSDLRNSVGHIASHFFEQPSRTLSVIGITGTNGKTSCSHFIAQILSDCNTFCGVMGTLGNGFLGSLKANGCTTLDPIQTQNHLFNLKKQGAETVAMEVTSHALTQGRVEGVDFHTAIYTNLTRDHLDYHANMEDYFRAKQRLFTDYKPKYSIINLDDEYGQRLIKEMIAKADANSQGPNSQDANCQIVGYSTVMNQGFEGFSIVTATEVNLSKAGIKAVIHSPWGEGILECPLLGRFNLSNLLAALSAVCVQGIPFEKALAAIKNIKTVSGRMMTLGGQADQPTVVVDYAHTPDALSKVLKALRAHCQGKLWCIFGCGGDRDRGKRAEMAKVVEELSDKIIITQDNPRTEDPNRIIEDILSGLKNPADSSHIRVDQNRRTAITEAVLSADPHDIVLVAGKGHEDYQIIGTEKYPFSDSVEVLQALNTLNRRTK